jgi:hypothetical protein
MKPPRSLEPQNELAPWLTEIHRELDADASALDWATQSRLNRARQAALIELGRRPRWRWPTYVLATAFGLALALFVFPGWRPLPPTLPTPAAATASSAEDFDLVAGADNLALVSDWEFYAWLDSTAAGG